jgi:predicted phosphodiesterase
MNKILIIGDIHGRTFWKEAVEKHINDCDKIIFLGDYLDAYPHEEITRRQEKENFEEIIKLKQDNPDKVVLLLGNHDLHYIDDSFTQSSRHSSSHARTYKEMFLSHMSFFKIAHEETINDKKFLFTHAGVMKSWYDRNKETIGELTVDNLNNLQNFKGGIRALGEVSKRRSWLSEFYTGGPLWSDVYEKINMKKSSEDNVVSNDDAIIKEFDFQIFGHTQMYANPIQTNYWACVDCRRAFILNDKGTLTEA